MIDDVLLGQRDPCSPLGLTFDQERQSANAEALAVIGLAEPDWHKGCAWCWRTIWHTS